MEQVTPHDETILIFDFDGTLIDSLSVFHSCFNRCYKSVTGRPGIASEEFLSLFDHNLYLSLSHRGIGEESLSQLKNCLAHMLGEHIGFCKLFDGIAPMIRELGNIGRTLYIVTSNLSSVVRPFLGRHDLDSCFRQVLGAELGMTKIEAIRSIKSEQAGKRKIYIGDTIGDMLEGKEAGCRTIGVCWGWHSGDRILSSGADALIHNPEELIPAVQELLK